MEVIAWDDISKFSPLFENGSAVTVGSFDGPHRGHDLLFDAVLKARAEKNIVPVVVTFRKSAAAFHAGKFYEGDVATLSQRLAVFDARGIEVVLVIDFSEEFTKIKGEEFLSFLVLHCGMKFIAEGIDFKCGFKGATGKLEIADFAKRRGIDFVFCNHVIDGGDRISSSRIRGCVCKSMFADAERLLGRRFAIDCGSFLWRRDGGKFFVPRLSCAQVLPPCGEYSVLANLRDGKMIESKFFVDGQNIGVALSQEQIEEIKSIEFF